MARDLSRLLNPKTIAVIGGGAWCVSVIENNLKAGFAGEIWPIHPKKSEIAGLQAFTDVSALPAPPDAVFIAVNKDATEQIVGQLSAMGAGGVVCFASGYLEAQEEIADGGSAQERLLAAAGDMPLIGPNCYGFVNALENASLWPDQHGCVPVERGVAILTQSSNIAINLTMQRRGLPIAFLGTLGNQAQTDMADLGAALLEDNRITALGLHIEGIKDLANFQNLAKRAKELGKPIVALKVGTSDAAQAATVSHTASLAGSDAGAKALLQRLGIARVDTLSELLESLKLLHLTGPLKFNKIASLSCSGGEASLVADLAEPLSLEFPALKPKQERDLAAALGPKVKLANPLDYHTYIWGDVAGMAKAYSAINDDDLGLAMIVADFPREDRCDPSAWDCIIEAAARVDSTTPYALVSSIPDTFSEAQITRTLDAGLVPLCGLSDALKAIEVAAFLDKAHQISVPVIPATLPNAAVLVPEAEAKYRLAQAGLDIPAAQRTDVVGVQQTSNSIGYPQVIKGEGIAHKTEVGAVVLNIESAEQAVDAARHMPTDQFLIEEMIHDGVAELLIGVIPDPAHGYVLTLGAGGVLTELMEDRTHLLLPVTEADVRAALPHLRITKLLEGYRGKPPADIDAICKAVLAIQDYVLNHVGQIAELEINPLICTPNRAVAADALLLEETHDG